MGRLEHVMFSSEPLSINFTNKPYKLVFVFVKYNWTSACIWGILYILQAIIQNHTHANTAITLP